MKGLVVSLAFVASAATADAATIRAAGKDHRGATIMVVDGEFEPADIAKFQTAVSNLQSATVLFRSDGGTLITGIEIGTLIRLRNFQTVVPNDARCASACAVAWLGGTKRFMAPRARIGFHAAYRLVDGKPSEYGAGNAILGAYLNRIALSDRAVFYITQAPPESMRWLNALEAKEVGIEVATSSVPFTMPSPAAQAAPESPSEKSNVPAKPNLTGRIATLKAELIGEKYDWGATRVVSAGQHQGQCYARTESLGGDQQKKSNLLIWSPMKGVPRREVMFTNINVEPGALILARVNGAAFPLVAEKEFAWFETIGNEVDFSQRIKDASLLEIEVVGSRGRRIEYTFSLSGAASALDAADRGCSNT